MSTIVTYERLKDRIGKTIYFMCKNRIQEAKITQAFETVYKTPWCRLEYEIKTNIRGWEHFNKSPTIWSSHREHNNMLEDGSTIRKLTPIECERLQTLPDNYTEWVSNSQRYKMLWNWRTIDVIAHILSFYYW